MADQGAPQGNKNAELHGAYAFKMRGEQALDPVKRTRLVELREQVQNREGVIAVMQEKAADSVLLFELVQSYVAGEVKKKVPLVDIPAVKMLPAFYNSMQRGLSALIALMPEDDGDAIDLEGTQRKYRGEDGND